MALHFSILPEDEKEIRDSSELRQKKSHRGSFLFGEIQLKRPSPTRLGWIFIENVFFFCSGIILKGFQIKNDPHRLKWRQTAAKQIYFF